MFELPLHPKLVHLPIALCVLMPLLTGGLLLAWWRGALPRRAWLIAVVFQVLLVVSGFAAMSAGEDEEERVEAVVPEAAVEAHAEAADLFVWASAGVLALMVVPLLLRSDGSSRKLAAAATLATVLVLVLGYRTGEAGGRLVYEYDAASAYSPGNAAEGVPHGSGLPSPAGEDDDPDDH